MIYDYAIGDLLSSPQTYQYSKYQGREFIEAWYQSRQKTKAALGAPCPMVLQFAGHSELTTLRLMVLCGRLRLEAINALTEPWFTILLKKFEVSKRLCAQYQNSAPYKAIDKTDYQELDPYLLLAEAIVRQWQHQDESIDLGRSYLLSGLLKLNDTLTTQTARMSPAQSAHFAWLLESEQVMVTRTQTRLGI